MQVMRLDVHFGSADVLANGRQAHEPQLSEKVRQSASVAQVVDVAGSALACDADGAGATGGGMDADGAAPADAETAGAATIAGLALGAGEGSCSPRLHAPARIATRTAAEAVTLRGGRAFSLDSADRTGGNRERSRGIAAA